MGGVGAGVQCAIHSARMSWEQKSVSGLQGYKGPLRAGKGSTEGLWERRWRAWCGKPTPPNHVLKEKPLRLSYVLLVGSTYEIYTGWQKEVVEVGMVERVAPVSLFPYPG